MKNKFQLILLLFIVFIISCTKNEVFTPDTYACNYIVEDPSASHPKATIYQAILDKNRKAGIIGASLMIKDKYGIWLGASGKADIASDVQVVPCNRFLIASITKVFTATAIFRYIDQGLLSFDDPVNKWIDKSITNKIANANEAKISHLLNHTSGLPDYYTLQFEIDRVNKIDNNWSQEDVLTYTYGKKATHTFGETYSYSNTNFLLLGMILEKVSDHSLEKVFQKEIFDQLNLTSAYYGQAIPIASDVVKGYVDVYGNGQYVESEFLYKDELNTADGGIAINAYDLGIFFESLMKGKIISLASLTQMTDWFDLPTDWVDEDIGHFQNGFGLEHNKTDYGFSVGHTGGIDGFLSIAQYFPEEDATFILLVNSGSYENVARLNIYNECLKEMFE